MNNKSDNSDNFTVEEAEDKIDFDLYGVVVPAIIFEMGLTTYERVLFEHYLRFRGHNKHRGVIQESTRQTAENCKISRSQIATARASLIEKGLITYDDLAKPAGKIVVYPKLINLNSRIMNIWLAFEAGNKPSFDGFTISQLEEFANKHDGLSNKIHVRGTDTKHNSVRGTDTNASYGSDFEKGVRGTDNMNHESIESKESKTEGSKIGQINLALPPATHTSLEDTWVYYQDGSNLREAFVSKATPKRLKLGIPGEKKPKYVGPENVFYQANDSELGPVILADDEESEPKLTDIEHEFQSVLFEIMPRANFVQNGQRQKECKEITDTAKRIAATGKYKPDDFREFSDWYQQSWGGKQPAPLTTTILGKNFNQFLSWREKTKLTETGKQLREALIQVTDFEPTKVDDIATSCDVIRELEGAGWTPETVIQFEQKWWIYNWKYPERPKWSDISKNRKVFEKDRSENFSRLLQNGGTNGHQGGKREAIGQAGGAGSLADRWVEENREAAERLHAKLSG